MREEPESGPGDPVIRVAILSPVRIVASLLAQELDRGGGLSVIAAGASLAELRPAMAQQPGVVLLVDDTARGFADTLAEALLAVSPRAVLVFGLPANARIVRRCLEAGVRGALGLEATLAQLRRAIDVVATGEVFLSPSIGALLGRRKSRAGWHPALTPRETEVAARMEKGESNAEIARELRLSKATVKIHVRHVLSKLGVASRHDIGEPGGSERGGTD